MLHALWCTAASGVMSAAIDAYRLTVQIVDKKSRTARFLVLRLTDQDDPGVLISSGTEPSVNAAIKAAERVAARWAGTTNHLDDTELP